MIGPFIIVVLMLWLAKLVVRTVTAMVGRATTQLPTISRAWQMLLIVIALAMVVASLTGGFHG